MSKFKVGDEVQELRFKNSILTIDHVNGPIISFKGEVYQAHEANYKLFTVYPNLPLSHFELRVEHAKGADIEFRSNSDEWFYVFSPTWLEHYEYRVKPVKSDAEKRIDVLQKMIDDHEQHIINCRCELSYLKPNINC